MATPVVNRTLHTYSNTLRILCDAFQVASEGLRLQPRPDGNFDLPDFAGLIVKHNYWCWLGTDKGGNTIASFVQVLGRTFHQAMSVITEQTERDGA